MELCRRIAAGVVECIMSISNSVKTYAARKKPDKDDKKDPKRKVTASNNSADDHDKAAVCPACKGRMRKTDDRHTRGPECKFRDVACEKWSCPGCQERLHRAHPSHTNDETCQWVLARTIPEGASRERKGSAPRGVRVPAYKDPSSTLRLSGNEDGIPGRPKSSDHDSDDGYSPTEPAMDDDALPESPNDDIEQSLDREVLTAEQAATRRLNKSEPANVPVRKNRVSVGVQSDAVNPKKVSSSSKMNSSVKQGDPGSAPGDDDGDDDAGNGDGESPQEPHWSQFDLGHALMQLRSIREGIVRRALWRLHLCWYHASNKRMRNLLEAVGVAPSVLNMIPSIIDTCSLCRNWQRVGPKSAMSARLPTLFNAEIQMDLLFYKDKIILHCVGTCIRWSSVIAIPDRSLHSLLEGYCKCWLQLYGPPTTIIADQEGGWATEQAATWFENHGSQMTLAARDQHCGVIERHNEILRRQLHLIEDESNNEGLVTSFDMILAQAIFAKNALFQIGNTTPYESLFGRTPPSLSMIGEEAGEVASDRDAARIRQASINAMKQASAVQKPKPDVQIPLELVDLENCLS